MMDLDNLSPCHMTQVFHIPPLNISHSYPVPQPVTETIIEDGYKSLDDQETSRKR